MTKKHRSLLLCLLALVLTVSCLPAAAADPGNFYNAYLKDLTGSSSKSYNYRKVAYMNLPNGLLVDPNSTGTSLATDKWTVSNTSIATVATQSQSEASGTIAKITYLKPGWVEVTHTYKKTGLLQSEKKTTYLVVINGKLTYEQPDGGYTLTTWLYMPSDVTFSGDPITTATTGSFYSKSYGKIPSGTIVVASGVVSNYTGNKWYQVDYNNKSGFVYSGSVKVLTSSVSISKSSATLDLNGTKTAQLSAKVYPTYASNTDISWSTSDSSVATVSSSGLVTAKKVGTATITAKNTGPSGAVRSSTCTVTVKDSAIHVTGVTVKPTTLTLLAGKYSTLTATVSPSNATNKSVTWSSSNTSVATVTSAGKVTGVAPGTATITVKTVDGGKTATCKVTVWKPTKDTALSEYLKYCPVTATTGSVTWNKSSTNESLYKIYRLPTTCSNTVSYTVSNVDKLSVSGKVTNHAGNLWYEVPGGYVYSGDVTYSSSLIASSVSLSSTSYSCHEGSTFTLTATVSPSGAANKNVTWSSSNPDIASVSSSGQVTAKTWGTTTITATAADGSGKKASCSVTVSQHSYSYTVTAEPTETTTGVLTGKCSCGAGTTVTLPALNSSEYSYETITYATTTSTGLGRYTWNDTRYGTFSFDVVIPIPESGAIFSQPKDQLVAVNESAAFTVDTTGPIFEYQWQWRTSASGEWKDCPSTTVGYNEMTLKPVGTAACNGYQYRCVVTDVFLNTLYTEPATLKVFAISGQPASQSVELNASASFKVTALNAASYQWQWRTGTSGTWANCSSATAGYNTATLKPVGTTARNGYQYRCIVKDATGRTATSNAATLTVKAAATLAITTQPASVSVSEGSTATFKVVATGAASYQWQWKTSAGTTWTNCSSATSGYNTATLKPVGTAARNGYQYRCIVKDASGNTVTSNTATLTVKVETALAITTQPVSVSVTEGSTATFKVVATGASSYQWQWRAGASGTWKDCSSATSGYNTATLKPVGTSARNGYQYRCVVKDASGNSVTSSVATLTVKTALTITAQPVSQTAALDSYAAFTVSASGSGLTYQWQWRAGASGTWKDCSSATVGYNKATLNPVAAAARNGYQYRCIVKDASGSSVTSSVAILTVK